ncbi:MAG TPA: glycosyltransferase family 4 protein [Tepidisphaeraceae bacterium]|nr:glycosyltransferase family 4 protein [Tepidisphaeraceae bacterium]
MIQSIQPTQPRPAWHWQVQQLAAMRAEHVVVNTPSAASCARRRSHIPPQKLVVIPNAVDVTAFARTPSRRADGLFRVGFIGRLDPVKRIDDLLRAARLLPRGIRLDIFGDGAERDRLHTLVHELGVGDRVTFHGTIVRPQLALQQIDALVLPSIAEGFGLVLIEAMAAGLPVIGTDVPGICDVIDADVNGLLVPVRSPASIARAILRLRDDATLRERLITAGRGTVADRYTFDRTIPRWRGVLGL